MIYSDTKIIEVAKKYNFSRLAKLCPPKELVDLLNSLEFKTKFLDETNPSFTERLYCIKNNIKERPKCKFCNIIFTKFNNGSKGYGSCCISKDCVLAKIRETHFARYGVSHFNSTDEGRKGSRERALRQPNKMGSDLQKQIMTEKYGVDNIFKTKGFSDVARKRMEEVYGDKAYNVTQSRKSQKENSGFENSFSEGNPAREKAKATNLAKFGVENVFQLKGDIRNEWNNKAKLTLIGKHGKDYIKVQIANNKANNFKKYGVENVAQVPAIFAKIEANRFKYTTYITPLGNEVLLQGYEPFVYETLLQYFSEDEIKSNRFDIPVINYIFDGKKCFYYPDFFIPKYKLIIEVKSVWTITQKVYKQFLKYNAVRSAGYDFCLEILDRHLKKDLKLIKPKL